MNDNSKCEAGSNSNLDKNRETLSFAHRVERLRSDFLKSNLCKKWLQDELKYMGSADVQRFNARVLLLSPFQYDCSDAFPRCRHFFRVAPQFEAEGENLSAEASALPFESEAFDVVIVQHVLEFSPNSQAVLKEAARVVRPNGKLMVFAVNPVSIGSALALLVRLFDRTGIWNRKTLLTFRLRDWLKFLDFNPLTTVYLGHALPFKLIKAKRYLRFVSKTLRRFNVPGSGVFVILAEKDQLGMTPLGGSWRQVTWQPRFYSMRPVQNKVNTPNQSHPQ